MSSSARAVTPTDYALILGSVGLGATGQVLMRLGMASLGGGSLAATVAAGLLEPLVWGGLVSYALSSAIWLVALSRVALSTAYPFGALSYVIVVVAALAGGEHVGPLRWLGVAAIVGGILLIGTGAVARDADPTVEGGEAA